MTIAQELRDQASNLGANVADVNGDDIQYKLNEMANRVEKLEEREHFLECLEACGVDNWDCFDFAHEMMDEQT